MRQHDWQDRIEAVLTSVSASDVAWAVQGATCLHLLQDTATAITGRDIGALARDLFGPAPSDARDLMRFVTAHGGVAGVIEAVARAAGFPEIPPDLAVDGDWAVTDDIQRLGRRSGEEAIVRNRQGWSFRLPKLGLVWLPATIVAPRRAWAVG